MRSAPRSLHGGLPLSLLLTLAPACITPPPPLPTTEPSSSGEGAAGARIAWEGRSPADLYAPGEVREFEISQGTQIIGHSWGRYVGPQTVLSPADEAPRAGGGETILHRYETRIELLLPGRPPVRAEGLLVLDDAGHLVRGHERSDAVELRFHREGELLALTDGTREDEVLYEPQRHDTAFMAHSAFFHEELMLGLRTLEEGAMAWRVISLSGGAPVEWEASLVRAPKQTGGTAVLRTNLGEEITIAQGRLLRSEVASSDLVVRAVDEPTWPTWTIEGPPTLTYEGPGAEVTVRELALPGRPGEPALFGELVVPPGVATPMPAVLWISGTGREDRHGFAGPPLVDLGSHEITDALARAGVAVLRFDERGRGRSEPGPLSFSGQLEDARRAYRTLVVQPEVDPDRVVIVAHGEGALRALSLAAQHGKAIAGVALLGSPGRPYLEVLRHQSEATLAQVPPELRDEVRKQQQQMLEELKAGTVPPELADHADWLRETLQLDPSRMVGQVSAPLWLAQGGKDFEVDPQRDPEALLAAAKARGRGHAVTLARYPELDHLFKHEPTRSDPGRYREPNRVVDPTFLADLCAWVETVTRPARRGGRRR